MNVSDGKWREREREREGERGGEEALFFLLIILFFFVFSSPFAFLLLHEPTLRPLSLSLSLRLFSPIIYYLFSNYNNSHF